MAGRLLQWSNRRDAVEVVSSLQDRGVQSSGGAEPGSQQTKDSDSVDPGKSRRCLSTTIPEAGMDELVLPIKVEQKARSGIQYGLRVCRSSGGRHQSPTDEDSDSVATV
jgi:hypothetical protein